MSHVGPELVTIPVTQQFKCTRCKYLSCRRVNGPLSDRESTCRHPENGKNGAHRPLWTPGFDETPPWCPELPKQADAAGAEK